jgi:hypothetical protein
MRSQNHLKPRIYFFLSNSEKKQEEKQKMSRLKIPNSKQTFLQFIKEKSSEIFCDYLQTK